MTGLFLAVLICAGCGDSEKKPSAKNKNKMSAGKSFPKVEDHNMELNVISTRGEYYRAEGAPMMRFQFINEGLNNISLPEWRADERSNFKVQYAECPVEGGSGKIPESDWKDSPRKIMTGDIPRYPIELMPKSSIIVDYRLDFIRTLKQPGRYAVRGVMDLTSIDVKSVPVELIIR